MAIKAATVRVVEEPEALASPNKRATVKAKAKAKGGKAKAKAKSSAKAKAMASVVEPSSPKALPVPKAKAMSFKDIIMSEVGERDIDEVIADTRKAVVDLQEAVTAVQSKESDFDAEIAVAKKAYDAANANVEEAKNHEALAFAKLTATREAGLDAKQRTVEAQVGRGDLEKTIVLLELEHECVTQVQSMKEAKEASIAAAETAKKALEDAKQKEKEAASAAKFAVADVRAKENDALQAIHDRQLAVYEQNKASKGQGKGLAKELNAEIKDVEKRRQEREKARGQKVNEAMGLGKSSGKGSKRSAEDVKSPAKAARIVDVD